MNYILTLSRDSQSLHNAEHVYIRHTTSAQAPILKRAFDIIFSLLVLILVMSWLIPLVSLLIRLDSKGPVFFKQLRTGKDCKPFYCFKFRSMHLNEEAHHRQASKADTRITRVGAWLRKTNVDEMPQFFNVLKGDMSVVGPRPHMLKHTEYYTQVIDNFTYRHTVKPGITGLAQIRGLRGETKEILYMAQRVKIDAWYINRHSLGLDLKIVFLTAKQMLRGNKNVF